MPIYKVKISWTFTIDTSGGPRDLSYIKDGFVEANNLASARDRVSRYWMHRYDQSRNKDFKIISVNEVENVSFIVPAFVKQLNTNNNE